MKKFLISFVFVLSISFFVTGCDKNSESSNTATGKNLNNNQKKSVNKVTNDLEKKIKTSGAVTSEGKLVVFVTNENSVAVDMKIEAEFYDADGTIVGSDDEILEAVGSDSEIVVEMYSTPESFDNYKIYVDVNQSSFTTFFDKLEISHNNNGEEIVVQVKNNSSDEIEYMTVAVVFYQGDKVVGYDSDVASKIKSGRSGNFKLMYPYDKNYHDIYYDNYKVFVTEAYTY